MLARYEPVRNIFIIKTWVITGLKDRSEQSFMNIHKVGCYYIFLKVKVSFYSVDVATTHSIITLNINTIDTECYFYAECHYSECRCEACRGTMIRFWGRIPNSSFSSELMNASNKLKSLSLASLSSLARYTILANWLANWLLRRKWSFVNTVPVFYL